MIKQFVEWIKSKSKLVRMWVQQKNFKIAVRKANYLQAKTFKKHLVYKMDGRFVVVERQELKRLYHGGHFKKGMNLKTVEAAALYKTTI